MSVADALINAVVLLPQGENVDGDDLSNLVGEKQRGTFVMKRNILPKTLIQDHN